MKTVFVLLLVTTVACMVSVEARLMQKRWLDFLNQYLKDQYLSAQASFESQVSTIDFYSAIKLLVPYIHHGWSVPTCATACTTTAASTLGPYGIDSISACEPLCEGAFIIIENMSVG